ncbi:gamma-glutamyltransferase family protein [Ensifer adhaerens]|uniref:gamma-glutamyltransferase family protein n=1 Tax=Ensifer adhaerens TaxID=106592 RepID=UPI000FD9CE25|nr:gamma-glutamyltransferase family protein [Ensifer adhaerens]MDF8357557.1 gamma-glutamyltransferase family protein [Ensifer adhaerens]THA61025.1 gamma-glutamyltransferase family protein [Ensifer adhaerens]
MRNFETPGRSLAVGRQGMAATSHPMSTLVAVEILKAGGTAVDAAVAACAVQCVVEAGSTGIGGDCFALVAPEGSASIVGYNGSGRTPVAADIGWYEAQNLSTIERASPHAVTVPGAVEAWSRLVADHGRMTLAEVLAPAVELARDGYAITPRVSSDITSQRDLLAREQTTADTFLVDGRAPLVGTVQYQPLLAERLEQIGHEGPDAFYHGEVASRIVAFLRERGGLHTLDDFAAARGEYVKPISTLFRGYQVHECPPNGQGIIALMILKILERFEPKADPLDIETLHVEVEAARLAYAARDELLGDGEVPVDYLLSDALANRLAGMIDPDRALSVIPSFDAAVHRDTVYISVVDRHRNAVSFINSIFHPYGSGLMPPETGVLLHNRGQSFSLKRGHPNAIGPRKRPMHTIIPGMLTKDGRVQMSFGVMGGHYQAMGQAHFLSKVLGHDLDLQTAVELPRLFPLPGTNTIEMEQALRNRFGAEFERRGFAVKPPNWAIGGAQAISIDWRNGTLLGASDHRKDGCALGY